MSWNIITVNGDDYDNENDHNDDDDDYDKYDENYLSCAAQMIFILTFPAARKDYWLL